MSDVEEAFNQLEQFSGRSPAQLEREERQFNLTDTQSAIIFDLVVLSQLSNTCKDVIGVSGWRRGGREGGGETVWGRMRGEERCGDENKYMYMYMYMCTRL